MTREKIVKELLKTGIYNLQELELLPEAILKDLYLKFEYERNGLNTDEMNILKSKPWVSNYLNYPNKMINVNKSLYRNYVDSNIDNAKGVAVFDGNCQRTITHAELQQYIDAFANGLKEYGIGEGSRIGVLVNGTYEEPINLLSINKLGAVIKLVDYTKSPNSIKNDIQQANLDMLFIDEMMLPLEKFINDNKLPVVVLGTSHKYSSENCIDFETVLNIGASKSNVSETPNKNKISVVINSSGTTGISKPIAHSNYSVNNSVLKLMYMDYPMNRNNFVYKAIPSHIGLGSLTTMYSGLISGTGVVLNSMKGPEESIESTIKFLKNYRNFLKDNKFNDDSKLLLFAAPMFYRMIDKNINIFDDLSFMGTLLAAGSKMSKEELDIMESHFRQKNCFIPICNGYGQNEQAGPVALNGIAHNLNGSAGYPVIGTDIKIVDVNSGKEIPHNYEGKILEKSDSEFIEYESRETETNDAKIAMPNGETWFDSKDLGYVDDQGFIHITGRISRVLIRYDCKILMDEIEQKIKQHSLVKDCAIIGIKHMGEDDVPMAFIELKEGFSTVSIDQVIKDIQSSEYRLTDLQMPVYFKLINSMPYLSSGKIDYSFLSELSKNVDDDNNKSLVKK